jgi:UDP-N-acetylmuramoyl-tripeptide--D-alanyl-D-alanine ligase
MDVLNKIYDVFLKSNGVSTDTRKVEKGQLFFALSGPNFNGNKFAEQALEKGAIAAVIDDESYCADNCFLVESSLKLLQQLATLHRRNMENPVIALTGSNGKTTTKELVACVLSKKYNTLFTEGNLNNHIGVPLTLLRLNTRHEIAIIEMGANHQGEISDLCTIAEPTHGMITNIGKAHLEGFGGSEGVRKGKTEMYRHLLANQGKVFFNHYETSLAQSFPDSADLIEFGKEYLRVNSVNSDEEGKLITNIYIGDEKFDIDTQLFGEYNINNVLSAIAVGLEFNVGVDDIIKAIQEYTPSNNRSEVQSTEKGNHLILDAYNANPTSMKNALEQLNKSSGKKYFILGAMKELGDHTEIEHLEIIRLATGLGLKGVFVGAEFKSAMDFGYKYFNNVESVENELDNMTDTTILIKGSRSMQLEKLKNKF